MAPQTISILGCGWYGLPLAKSLIEDRFIVKGSTTSEAKLETLAKFNIKPYLINFDGEHAYYDDDFFNCDILIISIPPKRNVQADYPNKIKNIASAAEKAKVKQIIFISSTGIYQDGNFVVNESVIPKPNTPAGEVLQEAESILKGYQSFETTIIRFAGLIGPDRNLAKHFAGKIDIPNGLAPINLIHLDDCIGLTKAVIDQKAFGKTYHGVTPNHPTRENFYTKACETAGLEKPSFKEELLTWKQIESNNVSRFLAYDFKVKDWLDYAKK